MKLNKIILPIGGLIYLFSQAQQNKDMINDPFYLLTILLFFAALLIAIDRRILFSKLSAWITAILFIASFTLYLIFNFTINISTSIFFGFLLLIQLVKITGKKRILQEYELKKLRNKLRQFRYNKNEFSE